MNTDSPWPPHLETFIREQVASGRFRSEEDLMQAGVRLLEEQSHWLEANSDWLKQEIDKGLTSRPAEPITKEFWSQLRERLTAAPVPGHDR